MVFYFKVLTVAGAVRTPPHLFCLPFCYLSPIHSSPSLHCMLPLQHNVYDSYVLPSLGMFGAMAYKFTDSSFYSK